MIQHYSSRHVFVQKTLDGRPSTATSQTILSAGKSYIFYGCSYNGLISQVWFEDQDGTLLWGLDHPSGQPTAFTDLRFVGTNGLVAHWNNNGNTTVGSLSIYLSDTGEGVPS